MARRNPLGALAGAVAIGVLIGLIVPTPRVLFPVEVR
jgi:hypothetical protein